LSKAVLNSSVIIALSVLGYLGRLKRVFNEVLILMAVYEEICVKGRGLIGERELLEAVNAGTLRVIRLMYDAKVIDKKAFLKVLEKLKETGFRVSDKVINKTLKKL